MGFFDDLVTGQGEPDPGVEPEEDCVLELTALEEEEGRDLPPAEYFLPGTVTVGQQVGASDHARVILTRWSVWPDQAILHLSLFRRRARVFEDGGFGTVPARPGGIRVGLLLADGRRVTTLDGAPGPRDADGSDRDLRLELYGGAYGRDHFHPFHYEMDLWLSVLPPEGRLELVVEWPDERVPEMRTPLDAAEIQAAAERSVEIWPDLPTAPALEDVTERRLISTIGPINIGPHTVMAEPEARRVEATAADHTAAEAAGLGPAFDRPAAKPAPPAQDPDRLKPRPDWEGVGSGRDWHDLALVRARLAGGADPCEGEGEFDGTPLQQAAERGSTEVVAELVGIARDVDAADEFGYTPLWMAVTRGRAEVASVLLAAGADAWGPAVGGRTPGSLALRTSMAGMFERLPGAVPLTEREREEQREADELIALFRGVEHTEGLSVAFVGGIGEEEAIRRLDVEPADCVIAGQEPEGFDPERFDRSREWIGLTSVADGCVLTEACGYLPHREETLERLSAGTAAYGLFFNPKGGTFGTLARDGQVELDEEVGPDVYGDSPEGHWLFRLWAWGDDAPYDAGDLAYACWCAGMRLDDCAPLNGSPHRWIPIPKQRL